MTTGVGIALDETVTRDDLRALAGLLGADLASAVAAIPADAAARHRRSCSRRSSISITPNTRCCAT